MTGQVVEAVKAKVMDYTLEFPFRLRSFSAFYAAPAYM
jgi:hypothetical protein